jgi:hypothetical protein
MTLREDLLARFVTVIMNLYMLIILIMMMVLFEMNII